MSSACIPVSSSLLPSKRLLAIEFRAAMAIRYSQNALQKMKNPGSVNKSNIRNTNGMLSKTGLLVVSVDTCSVKIYEAKNIKDTPIICPKTGNAIYLKNFSKFKKYSFTPLKNIFTALINTESFLAKLLSFN